MKEDTLTILRDCARERRMRAAVDALTLRYGDGAVVLCGASTDAEKRINAIEIIPTGILPFDRATRIGGIPRRRITEIFGTPVSGKTSVALFLIAHAQKQGGLAAFIDAEHAFNQEYAARLGVRMRELLVSTPETGEDSFALLEMLVRTGVFDVIVVDSVAALLPYREIHGKRDEAPFGLQARLMSAGLKRLITCMRTSPAAVVFINQLRFHPNAPPGYEEVTPGGYALQFYASLRFSLRNVHLQRNESGEYGERFSVTAVKNAITSGDAFAHESFFLFKDAPHRLAAHAFYTGFYSGSIITQGDWYTYRGIMLGKSVSHAIETLVRYPAIGETIECVSREHEAIVWKMKNERGG